MRGRFLLMHHGPLIGYRDAPGARRITTVFKRFQSLDAALAWMRSAAAIRDGRNRNWWIAQAGAPANRDRRRRLPGER